MTKTDQPRVIIFDTTLRDGEQSPGATMSHEEKLEIASLLDEMGVDVNEAGFPIASEGDFAAVAEIARRSKNSTICGLSRANFKDIDRCWEAVKHRREAFGDECIEVFMSMSNLGLINQVQGNFDEAIFLFLTNIASSHL